MHSMPQYTTKIIAGKLVTVPVKSVATNQYCERGNQQQHQEFISGYHNAGNDVSTAYSARLEAQRNKARALTQTYRSVLTPEPRHEEQRSYLSSDPLAQSIVENFVTSTSRYKLMSTLSSMRRLDPRETGLLSLMEIQDVMSAHNIKVNSWVLNELIVRYSVTQHQVDYRKMWKFVMDCYAVKDHIDPPARESAVRRNPQKLQESLVYLSTGLKSEVEFELRQYARVHQKLIDLQEMKNCMDSLDRYGTGKLLHKQVLNICEQYMAGINMDVLSDVIRSCDTEKSGMIELNRFLKLLSSCQPYYLPPLQNSPQATQALTEDEVHENYSRYSRKIGQEIVPRKPLFDGTLLLKMNGNLYSASTENIDQGANREKLKELGELVLHLSDFETKVRSEPNLRPRKLQEQQPEVGEGDRCSSAGTYTIGSPQISPRRSKSTQLKPIQHKSPHRKQWNGNSGVNIKKDGFINNPSGKIKPDKWWKHVSVDDEMEENRKNWKQSSRLKTIKSRKKKKRKFVRVKSGHCTGNEGQCFGNEGNSKSSTLTSGDSNSEMCTTTDVEVDETFHKMKLTFEQETDDEELLIVENSKQMILPIQNSSSTAENDLTDKGETMVTDIDGKFEIKDESAMENETEQLNKSDINSNLDYIEDHSIDDNDESKLPKEKLQLEWIYGYGMSNLETTSKGDLIFKCGTVVVIMNKSKQQQRFFRKHDATVTSFCLDDSRQLGVSAQAPVNGKTMLYTWKTEDLSSLAKTVLDMPVFILSIRQMKISETQVNLVLLTKREKQKKILIYDEASSAVAKEIDADNVLDFIISPACDIITYGKRGYLVFHKYGTLGELQSSEASFGSLERPKSILTAVIGKDESIVTGDSSGNLLLWKYSRICHVIKSAHSAPIVSLCFVENGFLISGSKDGVLTAWYESKQICPTKLQIPEKYGGVTAITNHDCSVYVSTTESIVLSTNVTLSSNDPLHCTEENLAVFSEGHPDIIQWLACHPSYNEIVYTLGVDGSLSMLNSDSKIVLWKTSVKGNGSILCIHPKDDVILAGCQDGSLYLLNCTDGMLLEKYKYAQYCPTSVRWSNVGTLLCVGYANGDIVILNYDERELEYQSKLKVHSAVDSLRWLSDGKELIVKCRENKAFSVNTETNEIKGVNEDIDLPTGLSTKQMVVAEKKNLYAFVKERSLCLGRLPCAKQTPVYSTPICSSGEVTSMQISCNEDKIYVAGESCGSLYQWKVLEYT